MTISNFPSKDRLKQLAKRLKKQSSGLPHMLALDNAAQTLGFSSYAEFLQQEAALKETPVVSSEVVREVLDWFRKEATSRGVDFSVFYPTKTGLGKSILDATGPVRLHFATAGMHDFASQQKGPDHRVYLPAYFMVGESIVSRTVSLYRPMTKNGDPRMWFKGLPEFAHPNDTVIIVIDQGFPYLINVQRLALEVQRALVVSEPTQASLFDDERANAGSASGSALPVVGAGQLPDGLRPIVDFLTRIGERINPHSQELLAELSTIAARGPIRSSSSGDTAVGKAVEEALNIKANSRKEPDYKNRIEIKAARQKTAGRRTRQTLFAQVADWGNAKTVLKSSAAILDAYGYKRDGLSKLYCTVSATSKNSQGLSFKISDDETLLMEIDETGVVVAVWSLAMLVSRLLQKHSETFWVEAKSSRDSDGGELFTLLSVRHTKAPLAGQLLPLIREGHITMDHLIKRREDGSVTEKGPLFKIAPEGFNLLFPEPTVYRLDTGTSSS